jgi:hypothetical protein
MSHKLLPQTTEYNHMINNIHKNLEGFDNKYLSEFNQIIRENKHYQLNLLDLIEKMAHFHQFTPESLEYMIEHINKHPQTFNGYGPYININGYWKIINVSVSDEKEEVQIKLLKYAHQINEQQQYITSLENIINGMKKDNKTSKPSY